MDDVRKGAPLASASFRQRIGWGLSEVLFACVVALALVAVFLSGRFAYHEGELLEESKGNAQALAKWAQDLSSAFERGELPSGGPCAAAAAVPPPLVVPSDFAAAVAPQGQSVVMEPVGESDAGSTPTAAAASPSGGAQGAAPPVDPPADTVAELAPDPAPGKSAPTVTWQSCREALFAQAGPLARLANPFDSANTVIGGKCEKRNAATRGHVLVEKGVPPLPGSSGSLTWVSLDDAEPIIKGLQLRIQVCDAGGYLLKVAQVTL